MKKGIEWLHQPEYTGKNRCEACTVVNVLIATALSVVVARKSKLIGLLTLGVSGALIYVRGYLVPGTPTITKRYFPESVLKLFGKDPEPETYSGIQVGNNQTGKSQGVSTAQDPQSDSQGESGQPAIDPEAYFVERGILEQSMQDDDLHLTDRFESEWRNEIQRINVDSIDGPDVATIIGVDAADAEYEIEEFGDATVLKAGGHVTGQWPSRAAVVADMAAARVISDWDQAWDSLSVQQRGELLNGLRLFISVCPTTGGGVSISEETVESCCQEHEVVAVTCEDTDERLFEHPVN